jgi:hypothetical protein
VTRHRSTSDADIAQAAKIYQRIVSREFRLLRDRGIYVVLAYHGVSTLEREAPRVVIQRTLSGICDNEWLWCIDLDEEFDEHDRQYFLADGHWNKKGHKTVGETLSKLISRTRPGVAEDSD